MRCKRSNRSRARLIALSKVVSYRKSLSSVSRFGMACCPIAVSTTLLDVWLLNASKVEIAARTASIETTPDFRSGVNFLSVLDAADS